MAYEITQRVEERKKRGKRTKESVKRLALNFKLKDDEEKGNEIKELRCMRVDKKK